MRGLVFAGVLVCFASGCACDEPRGRRQQPDAASPIDASSSDGGGLDATTVQRDAARDDASTSDAGLQCPAGYDVCDGACRFTAADRANCGGCGVTCEEGEACVASGCTRDCPEPLVLCGDRCVDVRSDSEHCSACDVQCEAGTGCSDRTCVPSVPVGPGPTTCADGRPLDVFTPEGDRCTGSIAGVSFTHALCTCRDIGRLSAPALFDAFDSTMGPYAPGGLGGSVGADGTLSSSSRFTATGDVRIAGASGFRAGSGLYEVSQTLRVASMFDDGSGRTDVEHDGYIAGPFVGGRATFGGALHTPSCAGVPPGLMAASCIEEPVLVPPPCACEPSDILPVGAMIAHYAIPANNDDALIGLDPDVLAAPTRAIRLDLPCGRYYLSSLSASRPVTIAVHGNAALFIGGDVSVSAALLLAVDPGATLDVFIGGRLSDTGSLAIGSPAYPTATRLYVDGPCHHAGAVCTDDGECCGGSCDAGACGADPATPPRSAVHLSVPADLNGLFYAPNGPVEISAPLEMYGAIFAYSFAASGETTIHYDRQASRAGEDCPPPPPGCGSCRDCDNQACIEGVCGDCRDDADCCSPLYCVGGRCVDGPF